MSRGDNDKDIKMLTDSSLEVLALSMPSTSSDPLVKAPSDSSRSWNILNPPLADWVLDAVSSMGFAKMTPVQASTIPLFMGHKDVVVEVIR